MRLDRVLHRQLVERELPSDRLELSLGGLEKPDPRERVVTPRGLEGVLDGQVAHDAASFLVDRAIDDHARSIAPLTLSREGLRVESRTQEMHQVDDPLSTNGTANAPTPTARTRSLDGGGRRADRAAHLRAHR